MPPYETEKSFAQRRSVYERLGHYAPKPRRGALPGVSSRDPGSKQLWVIPRDELRALLLSLLFGFHQSATSGGVPRSALGHDGAEARYQGVTIFFPLYATVPGTLPTPFA